MGKLNLFVDGTWLLHQCGAGASLANATDDWPNQFEDVTVEQIEKTRRAVKLREELVKRALKAGCQTDAVYRPPIKDYIIRKLAEKKYHEKQVDTSVVALLVRSAITRTDDYHSVVTGDADILPAVRVAALQSGCVWE